MLKKKLWVNRVERVDRLHFDPKILHRLVIRQFDFIDLSTQWYRLVRLDSHTNFFLHLWFTISRLRWMMPSTQLHCFIDSIVFGRNPLHWFVRVDVIFVGQNRVDESTKSLALFWLSTRRLPNNAIGLFCYFFKKNAKIFNFLF